jgi:polyhydroxyalkanoate synthesis regulator phasin
MAVAAWEKYVFHARKFNQKECEQLKNVLSSYQALLNLDRHTQFKSDSESLSKSKEIDKLHKQVSKLLNKLE